MSTYLQLVNQLAVKCGVTLTGGSLSSLSNLVGEPARLAAWINEAWQNIQMAKPNWNFMRAAFSFTTTTGQYAYTATQAGISNYGTWKMDSMRCYVTSVGVGNEMFLDDQDYDEWRDTFLFSTRRTTYSRPWAVALGPDQTLNLGPLPDSTGYTVVGEYFTGPVSLVNAADVPSMPSQYHLAIVYRAMMMYGAYESAAEVYNEGEALYRAMLRRMARDLSPDMSLGGALS